MKYFITALNSNWKSPLQLGFIEKEEGIYIDPSDKSEWKIMPMLNRGNLESGLYRLPALSKQELFNIIFSYNANGFLEYLPKRSIDDVLNMVFSKKKKAILDSDHNFYGSISFLFNNYPYELLNEIDVQLEKGINNISIIKLLDIELYCQDDLIDRLKEGHQKNLIMKWKQIKIKYNLQLILIN